MANLLFKDSVAGTLFPCEYLAPPKNEHPANQVSASCGKKVFWKCKAGHVFEKSPIAMFTSSGSGCPECLRITREANKKRKEEEQKNKKKRPKKGELKKSLLEKDPKLAEEYDKSNPVPADQISCGSFEEVLWRCKKHGLYKQILRYRVYSPTHSKSGCPKCLKEKNSHNFALTPHRCPKR